MEKIINNIISSKNLNRRFRKRISLLSLIFVFGFVNSSCGQRVSTTPRVHDPVAIKQGDTYYMFSTGIGISMFSSKDMKTWKKEKSVFERDKIPEWTKEKVIDFKGHFWAPDIYYSNSTYYLYYSVSSFGKNTSCIGLVTNTTLDPESPDYKWKDQGMVVQSVPGRDMWNAIDPNIIQDEDSTVWMSFGSFWNGIKLLKLKNDFKTIEEDSYDWHTISSRPRSFNILDTKAGDGAVEAPFIFKKDKYYYLFVSFDFCCRGKDSNYKIMVGRSEKVTGPYLDKDGLRMDQGGGSLLLAGNHKYPGVGHNAVYTFEGKDYLFFHAYDAQDDGKPKLLIKEMHWENGWPTASLEE